MKTLSYTQAHNAARLYDEMIAAIPSLAPTNGAANLLISSNGNALALTVPDGTNEALIPPVLAAHDPTPTPGPKALYTPVVVEDVRTTDATQSTLVSWPLAVQTLYTARFTILAVDTVNGDCRVWTAKATAKRLGAGAVLVGTPTLETSHADTGAASWALAADVSGNNFRVRVTGAAGRTISWSLVGEVLRARPDGLVDN
jgi:hypothetical protein